MAAGVVSELVPDHSYCGFEVEVVGVDVCYGNTTRCTFVKVGIAVFCHLEYMGRLSHDDERLVGLKEWECVQVNHHKDVGITIEKWQKNGWRLHTYGCAGNAVVALGTNHYLLFEKGE